MAVAPAAPSTGRARSAPAGLPPGPRLPGPAQTVWYTFGQPSFFASCRQRYGPTWTVGLPGFPPVVVTGDRDAIRALFTGDPLKRRHGMDVLRPFLGEGSIMVLEPAEHLARRRLESPPFHGEAVQAYSERIRELAGAEISSWPGGATISTHPRTRKLTLALILELVLGVRDPALGDELAALFESLNSRANNLGMFMPPAMGRRAWWNLPSRPFYARVDRIRALLGEHVRRSQADPGLDQRGDVLALLIRAGDEDDVRLSDADMRDELSTLVSAGHETTATAMAWACDLLAHNPGVADRMRATLAAGEREYLKATAREVLRARTVAYVSAGRTLIEPFAIGDWLLEPGAQILVDAQGVHGDPDLHPQPRAFRPERFLEDPPDSYAFIPFGGGAHRCLGAALAMLELEIFLEVLVSHVELSPAGAPARPVRRNVTLAPRNGGRVRCARAHRKMPATVGS